MRPDFPGALWIPSPHFFVARAGYTPKWVIVHGTAGGSSAENIAAWFANQEFPQSSHYVVGKDGTIVQCVLEEDGAGANCCLSPGHDPFWPTDLNLNLITISIEHVKESNDNSDILTPAQQEASFKLIRDICQRWQIPMRKADANGGITGHFSLDPLSRAVCPGAYPWEELWQFLQEETMIDLNNQL